MARELADVESNTSAGASAATNPGRTLISEFGLWHLGRRVISQNEAGIICLV
jgi:hypothetical protein